MSTPLSLVSYLYAVGALFTEADLDYLGSCPNKGYVMVEILWLAKWLEKHSPDNAGSALKGNAGLVFTNPDLTLYY